MKCRFGERQSFQHREGLRTLEDRRAIVGAFELATSFRFGGTPFDLAESGLRLYAKEVGPVVHSWSRAALKP